MYVITKSKEIKNDRDDSNYSTFNYVKNLIMMNFQMGIFPTEHLPTVFETTSANLTVDGKVFELTLWDTAGQEEYDRLRPLSYQKADVVLVCFSIDR